MYKVTYYKDASETNKGVRWFKTFEEATSWAKTIGNDKIAEIERVEGLEGYPLPELDLL